MHQVLYVGFWIVLTLASATTAVFIAQTLLSDEPVSLGLARNRQHTFWSRIYLVVVVIGWLAIVGTGMYGLLTWLPRAQDEGRYLFSCFVALFSVFALARLEDAAFLRQELAVESAALTWVAKQLRTVSTPSDVEIQRFEEESRDPFKTDTEQRISATILGRAKELRVRDERMETQFIQRLQREKEEIAAQNAKAVEHARVEAEHTARKTANEARKEKLLALHQLATNSPTVREINDIRPGEPALFSDAIVISIWRRTNEFAARALTPQGEAQLASMLQMFPGVELVNGVKFQLQYKGNRGNKNWSGDGYCDAYAIANGVCLPLCEGIRFTDSIEGLLTAFFLSAGLRARWSWGHGFYDRDHQLMASLNELGHLLGAVSPPALDQKDAFSGVHPPVGVRATKKTSNIFEVSCLAFREGVGLSDLSIEICDGKASALREQPLGPQGGGILY